MFAVFKNPLKIITIGVETIRGLEKWTCRRSKLTTKKVKPKKKKKSHEQPVPR